MTKKVAFSGRRPQPATKPAAGEAWVKSRNGADKQRLTLDIPADLHGRIKASCAIAREKMVDRITDILEREFPAG